MLTAKNHCRKFSMGSFLLIKDNFDLIEKNIKEKEDKDIKNYSVQAKDIKK